VFLNTCASVQYYTKLFSTIPSLKNLSINGAHGQLKPKKREKVFESFFKTKSGVLITTDVAARGIDFEKINQIIQIDPPEVPEQLVHRIGRTARVNRPGKALLML
jgi:ATP-dependent RNA helicase DDX55/SPB4